MATIFEQLGFDRSPIYGEVELVLALSEAWDKATELHDYASAAEFHEQFGDLITDDYPEIVAETICELLDTSIARGIERINEFYEERAA